MILTAIRFVEIRPIGFSKTTSYSKLFLAKLSLQFVQALVQALILIFFLIPLDDVTDSDEIREYRFLTLLYIVNIIAWIVAGKLLAYEYRKRLSETYYTHWLYWVLSFMS